MHRWITVLALLVASTGLLACGMRLAPRGTPSPEPSRPTAAPRGGIASGSANGPAASGLAPPAQPASAVPAPNAAAPVRADGTCPDSHPIKVAADLRAYDPGNAGYVGIRPIACYATLADAEANGYHSAGSPP